MCDNAYRRQPNDARCGLPGFGCIGCTVTRRNGAVKEVGAVRFLELAAVVAGNPKHNTVCPPEASL